MTSTPLWDFNSVRPRVLEEVASDTAKDLKGANLDLLLGEALYQERVRMKRSRPNRFTQARRKRDLALWGSVQAGLLSPSAIVDRRQLLERVLAHYAEEIGGHFDPKVYRFATHAVPWGFNWLLNAASVRRFLPWGLKESLLSRLQIEGEIEHLQSLSRQGTILLVPTHQSNMDSVLIGYVIFLMSLPPFAYGAGLNLFSNPALSFFMSNLGAYTVDRQKSNPIYKETLKNYSTRILREGVHSIFFPGGGRSRSGAIESKLKLGLLGTGLEAQIQNLRAGKPKPNVYVVPMDVSYHFVLEASSLIEDYLAEAGKARFIITDDESWQVAKIAKFFWRFFASQSGVAIRIGRPLDVFGNFVDADGRSIGPNGLTIEPRKWLTTHGELRSEPQRDREYTAELGERLIDRFHRENLVLSSHVVAFTLFETLRKTYPELDLYRFLRLSLAQRSIALPAFLAAAEEQHRAIKAAAARGEFFLSEELRELPLREWVDHGLTNLGIFHDAAVVKLRDDVVFTEDMNLLYYYRNRLSGYGLSLLANRMTGKTRGQIDGKGFLA